MVQGSWRKVVAVVLAGGRADDDLAHYAGVPVKALAPIGEKPMAAYVLEALKGAPQVERCIYVGPLAAELDGLYQSQLEPAASFAESLRLGLERACENAQGDQRVLMVGADIPWLSAEAVSDILNRAPEAALVYPVVPKAAAEAQFPAQERTYANLTDGVFTGGNLLLLTPTVVPNLLPLLERAYRVRKNPLALARIVGPSIMLRYLFKRLAIAPLEARATQLLGAPARVLISEHASIGADVDSPAHLQEARRALVQPA